MWPGGPAPNVIAANLHAMDDDLGVVSTGEISLHGLIRTVRIANEHPELLFHDVVEAIRNL
jgi:hypothetical protein